MAELRQIRNEQRDKERELSSREEKIRRAQELKENIGKLVLEHKRAQMSVEEETEKLKKITAESMAKMGLIKDREIELMKRAARLQRKEDFLVQKEADLRQQKIHTLHEEFQAIKNEPDISFEIEKIHTEYPQHPRVMEMLRTARGLIRDGRIDQAKQQIRAIEDLQATLKPEDKARQKITYDVLELKTEMKLAMLQ